MMQGLDGPRGDRHDEDSAVSTAQTLVRAARRHLGMDLAFVAELAGGRQTFRFVDFLPGAVRLEAGDGHELSDTYCQHLVTGRIPSVIPDTKAVPAVGELPVTDRLGIASYIGVPVRYSDGRLFGTLCCLAHVKHHELGEEQRRYLAVLAEAIAAEMEVTSTETTLRHESRERVERVIGEGLFFPVYQPIVELTTGRIVGAEALTRFTADDRSPFAWFAEAATVGLGPELQMATASAAVTAFGWPGDVYLALNLSPSALESLLRALQGGRADPARLVVEVTEHAEKFEYPTIRRTMAQLRDLGVRIAVDDTGAGVASLHHILEIGPDIIKLDLTLTNRIDIDPARQALAQALGAFAARVGMTVIAEGIETPAQLQTVSELGIDLGQGYHLGRPQPLPLPTTAPRAMPR